MSYDIDTNYYELICVVGDCFLRLEAGGGSPEKAYEKMFLNAAMILERDLECMDY